MRSRCEAVIAGKSIWIGRLVIEMDARRRYLDRVQPTRERLVVPGMLGVVRREQREKALGLVRKRLSAFQLGITSP